MAKPRYLYVFSHNWRGSYFRASCVEEANSVFLNYLQTSLNSFYLPKAIARLCRVTNNVAEVVTASPEETWQSVLMLQE